MAHDLRPVLEKSVDDLEGCTVPPRFATGLIERVAVARRVPLRNLSVRQIRLLIAQGQALPYLLPLALDRLEIEPLPEGDFYRGELLVAVLRAETRCAPEARFKERLRRVVASALDRLREVQPVDGAADEVSNMDEPDEFDRRNLVPELHAALERLA